ncbi:hypothetical protein RZS08_20910, partial [Arthrospira platensis SPKY1]|nr:hypothetical protein [Arthrospira platensis SPKY1]
MVAGPDVPVDSTLEPFVLRTGTNILQNGDSKSTEADGLALVWLIDDLGQTIFTDAIIYDIHANSRDEELGTLFGMIPIALTEGSLVDRETVSLHRRFSHYGERKNPLAWMEATPSPVTLRHVQLAQVNRGDHWMGIAIP